MTYLEQALSWLSGNMSHDRIAEAKKLIRKAIETEQSSLPTLTPTATKVPYSTEKVDNSLLVVKIGSDDRPATQEDVDDIRKAFQEARNTSENIVVTHHLIDVEIFSP